MTVEEKFAVWWAAYPRKLNKKDAFKAFKAAIKRTTLEDMLKGLEADKKHRDEHEQWREFCYPATWLRGNRWENEWGQVAPKMEGYKQKASVPVSFDEPIKPRVEPTAEQKARVAALVDKVKRGMTVEATND